MLASTLPRAQNFSHLVIIFIYADTTGVCYLAAVGHGGELHDGVERDLDVGQLDEGLLQKVGQDAPQHRLVPNQNNIPLPGTDKGASVVDPDPYSGDFWFRIRIRNTDPEPHMQTGLPEPEPIFWSARLRLLLLLTGL